MANQPRVVVCGVGRMGQTIAWSMDQFGFHVIGLDQSEEMSNFLPGSVDFVSVKNEEDIGKVLMMSNPDVVISSLPYHQTEGVAEICIDNKYNYCDLGGKVQVSQKINNKSAKLQKHSGKHVFTDLGLAPGWVNILAEHGCRQIHKQVDSVKMMVGGLPQNPKNPPLNYSVTWSIDGLINEYKDKCKVLRDGEERWVNGMDGLETVATKSLGELEAFYTSGGASHSIKSMQSKKVKDCSYKTLRYKGHCDMVNFLIRNSELSEDCLFEVFNKGCADEKNSVDVVIMKVIIEAKESSWEKEILINGGQSKNGFSAMQKATGFSISSVAKMMAENFFEENAPQHRDYYDLPPTALSYRDVNYETFMENMNFLRLKMGDTQPYERD